MVLDKNETFDRLQGGSFSDSCDQGIVCVYVCVRACVCVFYRYSKLPLVLKDSPQIASRQILLIWRKL